MPKQTEFEGFLTDRGKWVYSQIEKHLKKLKMMEVDALELSMLANAFDLYASSASLINKEGRTIDMITKTGVYKMLHPEYKVMTVEYGNILKHGAKFGLNPGDREKIFKGLKEKEKLPDFEE